MTAKDREECRANSQFKSTTRSQDLVQKTCSNDMSHGHRLVTFGLSVAATGCVRKRLSESPLDITSCQDHLSTDSRNTQCPARIEGGVRARTHSRKIDGHFSRRTPALSTVLHKSVCCFEDAERRNGHVQRPGVSPRIRGGLHPAN